MASILDVKEVPLEFTKINNQINKQMTNNKSFHNRDISGSNGRLVDNGLMINSVLWIYVNGIK